ncbi:hypothetical protein D3C86_966190 [compost metagenome]
MARKYYSLRVFHLKKVRNLYFSFEPAPFECLDQIFFKVAVIAGECHRIEQSLPHTAFISRNADTEIIGHFGMCPEFTLA